MTRRGPLPPRRTAPRVRSWVVGTRRLAGDASASRIGRVGEARARGWVRVPGRNLGALEDSSHYPRSSRRLVPEVESARSRAVVAGSIGNAARAVGVVARHGAGSDGHPTRCIAGPRPHTEDNGGRR